MEEQSALAALLAAARIAPSLIESLAHYGALLLQTNRRFNLTGADTPEELAPHLLDSLSIVPYVQGPLIDVGSGGGLPAIPLAIATGVHVTLVESTTKKAAFLEAVLGTLGVAGQVIPQRAELAARDPALREQFASATARAVSSAPTVLELAVPFVRVGGVAVLQRGQMDAREREAVRDAAPMLGAVLEEEVLLEGERRVLLATKTAPTPQRFPRRTGIPEKRPLCFS
ncbi:MAG TPA: 16S rRNA (guanine(527)-N(7))-methyltransferase RsmG [Candidatus Baltobacteraceae bacterium]|nr:16S rRNA (guanine(527)-N(7))-methyltransferase RsmG [Candidatus Baltobacteraceae bacterium]